MTNSVIAGLRVLFLSGGVGSSCFLFRRIPRCLLEVIFVGFRKHLEDVVITLHGERRLHKKIDI